MSEPSQHLEDDALWYKDAVIYELHVRAFCDSDGDGVGDFRGLSSKIDYLEDLGVTAIWILPFYPSPLRDDGYDISDYYGVHSQYGALKDFRNFLNEAHKRGIRVITELVVNHTSDQHPWFQKSRTAKANTKWRDFYVWNDTQNKYMDARIIFKDFESSNWSWDTSTEAFYWHRFYSHQPDLNYDSPEVRKAVFEVLDFWLKMGVDGLRLDAVPYLFERDGTNCENLPETHAFLKELRTYIDSNFKNRMLLAEANQWPSDAAAYFGNGDESNMNFHFPLMPRMFMAIQLEDRFPLIDILDNTPQIPETCQWALFLRNHDELTLEMVTDEERDYMYRVYARNREARINLGIRKRLAPLLGNNRRKMELMNILLFTMPGTPVLYYGDEIGMGDNHSLGDRNGVRTPMQWNDDMNAGFSNANPQKLYLPVIEDPKYHYEAVNVETQLPDQNSFLWWMRRIITLRKSYKALGRGTIEFLFPENNKILAFVRRYENEKFLVAVNLSRHPQLAEFDLSQWEGHIPKEVFGGTRFPQISGSVYHLGFDSYGYYIFLLTKEEELAIIRIDTKPELYLEKGVQDLFTGKAREKLETVALPAFIRSCRWFTGRPEAIELVRIREVLPIERDAASSSHILILDVYYKEGLPEAYFLPVGYVLGNEASQIDEKHPQAVMAKVTVMNEKGVIYDGSYDQRFRSALLRLVTRGDSAKGNLGELVGIRNGMLSDIIGPRPLDLESTTLEVEQSNTSIKYEDKIILKFFRRAEEGVNPELDIGRALTGSKFPHIAPVVGEIRYSEPGAEPIILAVLHGFIGNKGDSWKLCSDEVAGYYERVLHAGIHLPPDTQMPSSILDLAEQGIPSQIVYMVGLGFLDLIGLLGKRIGELHIALLAQKSDPDFSSEPFGYLYQVALSQSMSSYAKRILQIMSKSKTIGEDIKPEIEKILSNQNLLFDHFKALLHQKIDAVRIRTHGKLSLGEVLYTGTDFIMTDFEGDSSKSISERRLRRSALRDTAGMIMSIHYVAYLGMLDYINIGKGDLPVLEKWADAWYKCTAATFLKSYLGTVEGSEVVPKNREALASLLNALLLEKAIYQLGYEMNNRPERIIIPVKGLKSLLEI